MIANLETAGTGFNVDTIITHKFDGVGEELPNGPLVVVDLNGNVVRGI